MPLFDDVSGDAAIAAFNNFVNSLVSSLDTEDDDEEDDIADTTLLLLSLLLFEVDACGTCGDEKFRAVAEKDDENDEEFVDAFAGADAEGCGGGGDDEEGEDGEDEGAASTIDASSSKKGGSVDLSF